MSYPINFLVVIVLTMLILSDANAHDNDTVRSDHGPTRNGSVLVFSGTGWYRHPETAAINGWLARLADETGMQIDITETPSDLKRLEHYDVLALNNSNELTKILDENQRKRIRDWYRAGGGIVALHAALVHQTQWKWFSDLGGCDFNSDSDFVPAMVTIDASMKDHPTVHGHAARFQYTADWTNHTRSVSKLPGFKVLLRVDESTFEPVRNYFRTRGGEAMGSDHPVSWLHENDGGRFFYTELGHDVRSLDTKFGRQHIIQAIRWAATKR
ncbi:MAG: ThuA domain-containing protein [Planctomycetota bacterium]